LMIVGLWTRYDFYFNQQSGWRCFQEPHDPRRQTALFAACIVEKTRWDMVRNPQLYVAGLGVPIDPTKINFEFLGVTIEEGGLPIYRFRYLHRGRYFCRYYDPWITVSGFPFFMSPPWCRPSSSAPIRFSPTNTGVIIPRALISKVAFRIRVEADTS
jgi:hypothetical protein